MPSLSAIATMCWSADTANRHDRGNGTDDNDSADPLAASFSDGASRSSSTSTSFPDRISQRLPSRSGGPIATGSPPSPSSNGGFGPVCASNLHAAIGLGGDQSAIGSDEADVSDDRGPGRGAGAGRQIPQPQGVIRHHVAARSCFAAERDHPAIVGTEEDVRHGSCVARQDFRRHTRIRGFQVGQTSGQRRPAVVPTEAAVERPGHQPSAIRADGDEIAAGARLELASGAAIAID